MEICRNFGGFCRDFRGILSELQEILEDFQKPKIFNPSVPKDEVVWLVVYVLQRVSNNWIRNFIKSVTEFLPNSRFLSCRFKVNGFYNYKNRCMVSCVCSSAGK